MKIYIKPEKRKEVYISASIGFVASVVLFIIGFNLFQCILVFTACLTFVSTMKDNWHRLRNGTNTLAPDSTPRPKHKTKDPEEAE